MGRGGTTIGKEGKGTLQLKKLAALRDAERRRKLHAQRALKLRVRYITPGRVLSTETTGSHAMQYYDMY